MNFKIAVFAIELNNLNVPSFYRLKASLTDDFQSWSEVFILLKE